MSEAMNYRPTVGSTTPELDQVHDYLLAMLAGDEDQYKQALGGLDNVMYRTPDYYADEVRVPSRLITSAITNYAQEPSPMTRLALHEWQTTSTVRVVRDMIQGRQFPLEQFGAVIDDVRYTLVAIDGGQKSNTQHDKQIRGEIRDVWSYAAWRISGYVNPVEMRRAAEAYKFVGRSRTYGRMMARVMLAEQQRGMY